MVLPTLLVFQLTFLGPQINPINFHALIFAPRLEPLWPRSHGNHRYLTAWARVEEVGKSWKIPFDPSKLLAMWFYNIYISQYTLDFETRLHDFGTSTHEFETFTTLRMLGRSKSTGTASSPDNFIELPMRTDQYIYKTCGG
jgi:hypothetical protein